MLGVLIARIKTETTDTTCVANTSPSAASADLNGKATKLACQAPQADDDEPLPGVCGSRKTGR
jgi:xanthine dehydrogenase molybdopterin-binding subunit B